MANKQSLAPLCHRGDCQDLVFVIADVHSLFVGVCRGESEPLNTSAQGWDRGKRVSKITI